MDCGLRREGRYAESGDIVSWFDFEELRNLKRDLVAEMELDVVVDGGCWSMVLGVES